MNQHINSRTVQNICGLIHKTQPESALFIAIDGIFNSCAGEYYHGDSGKVRWGNQTTDPYNIDCGMNFLGSKGEVLNHQIENRGAKLICDWNGPVSNPLKCDQLTPLDETDVLYDVDGSNPNSNEIDPKYILPNGSSNSDKYKLLLKMVEFIDSEINGKIVDKKMNEIAAWLIISDKKDISYCNRKYFSLFETYKVKKLKKYFLKNISNDKKIEDLSCLLNNDRLFYEKLSKWANDKTKKLNCNLKSNPKQIKLIPKHVSY